MTTCVCGLYLRQIVVVLIILTQYMENCTGIESKVNLEVEGFGFHRTLIYRIRFKNLTNKDCQTAIHLELPSALYVNLDEITELRRQGVSTVCSVGETDVELFMEKARSQNVTVCGPVNLASSVLRIPIHQRYQYARKNGGYVNVILHKPKVLLGCKDRVKNHRVSKINLCEPCVNLAVKWRNIPYNMTIKQDNTWLIPVGDSSLLPLISCVTLLITIIGAIFVARAIWMNASKKQKKKD